METLWQDLRYGARQLARSPGFTAVAVLTLALGIGANTAIFQLLDAVQLRALPVERPHELAEVTMVERRPRQGSFNGRAEFTNPLWEQIRDRQQAFSGIFAWGTATFNLTERGEDRFAENGLLVSGDFFNVLGVRPILGRVFTPADDQRGCGAPGAVISYAFWQREFGGDLSVVGKKLSIDGHPFEVIGVTPASFFGVEVGRSYDLAIPICADAILNPEWNRLDVRNAWWLAIIGRLKPGWTLEQATAHLTSISPALLEEAIHPGYTAENRENYLSIRYGAFPAATGVSALRRQYETPLWLLLGATGLVLLIACANIANLMLARASARERELVVRLALGASRVRLVRQLLTESLLLAGSGAVLGAWLAQTLSYSVVSLLSGETTPLFLSIELDSRVLAFTAGVGVLTCVLFGLLPALRATPSSPVAAMSGGGRGMTASRERSGLRRALVVAQVALSLVLLMGALLFSRSLYNLMVVDTGFQQEGILQLDIRYWVARERRVPLQQELADALRATPGVDAAALVSIVPLGGSMWNDYVFIDGRESYRGESRFNNIGPGYFETLRIPLLAGRDFDSRDTLAAPRVAIVNEAFVRLHLNGASPLGRTFRIEVGQGEPQPVFEIVGYVKNSKYEDLRAEFPPIAYLPQAQDENPDDFDSYLIRSSLPPANLMGAVRRTVEQAHPGGSFHFHNFRTQIRELLVRDQLMATLVGFFGLLAVVLASLGLYGVLSYAVVKRTNEIGIRMALGAQGRDILSLILRDAAVLLGLGLVLGAGLAVLAARVTRTLLYGLEPSDPLTLVLAVLLLSAVTVAAGYIPARRAARVDPMVALRYE